MEVDPVAPEAPGWLEREFEREGARPRVAALADPMKPFTNEPFGQAAEDLGAFARGRAARVTAEVAAAKGDRTAAGRTASMTPPKFRRHCGRMPAAACTSRGFRPVFAKMTPARSLLIVPGNRLLDQREGPHVR